MYRRNDQLFSIGTDRNLNFWNINEGSELRFNYAIKFLGSSVRQIATSES